MFEGIGSASAGSSLNCNCSLITINYRVNTEHKKPNCKKDKISLSHSFSQNRGMNHERHQSEESQSEKLVEAPDQVFRGTKASTNTTWNETMNHERGSHLPKRSRLRNLYQINFEQRQDEEEGSKGDEPPSEERFIRKPSYELEKEEQKKPRVKKQVAFKKKSKLQQIYNIMPFHHSKHSSMDLSNSKEALTNVHQNNHFKLNDYQPFPYKRASSRICLSEASQDSRAIVEQNIRNSNPSEKSINDRWKDFKWVKNSSKKTLSKE